MTAVFASGAGWVGKGVQSIESGLHDLFENAKHRIVGTAYSITPAAFDLPPTWIAGAIDRGVEVVLVVNRASAQHKGAIANLVEISRSAPGLFKLYDFDGPERCDLHAKVVVADEELAIVGSSNYSARGLLHNYELAVRVEGEAAAKMAAMVLKITGPTYARRLR